MASLELYSRTNSCGFCVELSKVFILKYYKKLKITEKNYGREVLDKHMSDAGDFLVIEPNEEIIYGEGEVSTTGRFLEGKIYFLDADKNYKLYAYAQAKNGRWYLAGSDTVKPKEKQEVDLRIIDIEYDGITLADGKANFKIKMKNKGNKRSSDYKVGIYYDDKKLGSASMDRLGADDTEWTETIQIDVPKKGRCDLEFYIQSTESKKRSVINSFNFKFPTSIYCPASKAKRLGYTISGSYTLSRAEAKELRNHYEDIEQGRSVGLGLLCGLFGLRVKKVWSALGFLVGVAVGEFMISEHLESLDNQFDDLATGAKNATKLKINYVYKRHTSYDGAYFLESIEIL